MEMTWLKSLRLHWDSVNYHWQRGFVGFNLERQRDFLRDIGLKGAPPWRLVAPVDRAYAYSRVGGQWHAHSISPAAAMPAMR